MNSKNQPAYSIVIPVYREADRIGTSLEQLSDYLKESGLDNDTEVVISVQDGETDGTADIVKSKAALFTNLRMVDAGERQGKGQNVKFGIQEARGAFKLFMDADLATPLHHIQEAFAAYRAGHEVVICIRNLGVTHTGIRKLISEFGNILVRIVLLPGIHDSQCGFKGFSEQAAKTIFSRQTIDGWGFDMELLAIARVHGYHIHQIKANDWKDPKMVGLVGDSSIKVAIQTFRDLLRIRWNKIMGRYK